MTTLALLALIPFVWTLVAKRLAPHELTLSELAGSFLIGLLVLTAGWYTGRFMEMADREVLNGEVLSKASERVSCEHSYKCNCSETCTTNSDGSRSCYETCSTCHEHAYDVDWNLQTSVGEIEIDRVDRRGTTEPPRFNRAQVGDPVAQTSIFVNYIKAAPDSLFNAASEKMAHERFADRLPEYPLNVYDYHYLNRVIPVGVGVPNLSDWNLSLAMKLRKLGPSKQLNLVVVMTKESDPTFARALRAHWLGGKKNDVVIVLGVPEYPKIAWADVISWTDKELFKVELRDALQRLPAAEPAATLDLIETHVKRGFVRRPMADFEYLTWEIEPPTWAIALIALLALGASIWSTSYFSKNRLRPGNAPAFRRRYR